MRFKSDRGTAKFKPKTSLKTRFTILNSQAYCIICYTAAYNIYNSINYENFTTLYMYMISNLKRKVAKKVFYKFSANLFLFSPYTVKTHF